MKEFVVAERKGGVSISIEDPEMLYRETIVLTWKELAGLHWAIEDTLKHPSFKHREPRERQTRGVQKEYIKHIYLIEEDGE